MLTSNMTDVISTIICLDKIFIYRYLSIVNNIEEMPAIGCYLE